MLMTMDATEPVDRMAGLQIPPAPADPSQSGIARGRKIAAGTNDDGWIIPPAVSLTDGTLIQLYKDGEAWHAAFDAVRDAKKLICLEIYIFASDDTGRAMADLLCKKARQGVRVFVIYDSFGSFESDRNMFHRMTRAGVVLQEFHPLRPWDCKFGWRPVNRDHRKLLVIDNHIAGLGGMNLALEYSGSWALGTVPPRAGPTIAQWRDNAIGIEGPAVAHLTRSFARTWNYLQRGGRIRRAEFIHNIHGGEFGVLASVPTINSPLQPLICRLLREAKKNIQLTMAYFAPDDALIDELCRAADRGVHVQLMLPGHSNQALLIIAARSFYEKLMSHRIDIYERRNVMLHAKTMVMDGHTTVIGSVNLDYRSIEYNCELSAVVVNETFGMQMRQLFDFDIIYSKQIDPEAWRHRPLWDRIGQWAVSRARYLL